ncbi:hypothetical protein HYV81_01725 [Candidatus Woesearchaeota archaeon]|nr:hypothetical protein [Candidatus Woesearchaeota archaeon]
MVSIGSWFRIQALQRHYERHFSNKRHYFSSEDVIRSAKLLDMSEAFRDLEGALPGFRIVKVREGSEFQAAAAYNEQRRQLVYRWEIKVARGCMLTPDIGLSKITTEAWMAAPHINMKRPLSQGRYGPFVPGVQSFGETLVLYAGGLKGLTSKPFFVLEASLDYVPSRDKIEQRHSYTPSGLGIIGLKERYVNWFMPFFKENLELTHRS